VAHGEQRARGPAEFALDALEVRDRGDVDGGVGAADSDGAGGDRQRPRLERPVGDAAAAARGVFDVDLRPVQQPLEHEDDEPLDGVAGALDDGDVALAVALVGDGDGVVEELREVAGRGVVLDVEDAFEGDGDAVAVRGEHDAALAHDDAPAHGFGVRGRVGNERRDEVRDC